MAAQIRRLTGPIGPVFALLVSSLVVGITAGTAHAADCLTAPNSTAPGNSHWFYRTDRTQQRKCWYLRADDQSSRQGRAETNRETAAGPSSSAPSANPYSLADFKDYLARRIGTNVPDKDVEKLYAEFLEWRRRAAN